MGRIVTPKYRIEILHTNDRRGNFAPCAWRREYGRANQANLERWRQNQNRSYLPDGINHHISDSAGFIVHISRARIVNQLTGNVVCEVKGPMFEIVA